MYHRVQSSIWPGSNVPQIHPSLWLHLFGCMTFDLPLGLYKIIAVLECQRKQCNSKAMFKLKGNLQYHRVQSSIWPGPCSRPDSVINESQGVEFNLVSLDPRSS